MTQAQIKDFIIKAQAVTQKAIASKAEARDFLVQGGFCTRKGDLTKTYRPK